MLGKIKKRFLIITYLWVFLCLAEANADVNTLIKNAFPKGTMSNVTTAKIVKGQRAGHLVGGSVMIKTPAQPNLRPITIRPPSCSLGGLPCGAQIDFRAGGISFIKADEMMEHLNNIVSSAGTYAGIMAIKSICPQCEDAMAFLNDMAQHINSLSIDSCKTMEMLARGPISALEAGAQATRQTLALIDGKGSDMAEIQKNSKKDEDIDTESNEQTKALIGDDFNLVWKALKQQNISIDREFGQLLMSISGTVIGKKDKINGNGVRHIRHHKSLATDELITEFVGANVKGNGEAEIEIYSCKEGNKCLEIEKQKVQFDGKKAMYGRIEQLLGTITEKVWRDAGEFTAEEEMVISLSSIPLINKIETDLAAYGGHGRASVMQQEFVEALCYDVATSYLQKLLHEVQTAVDELSHHQVADPKPFQDFDRGVREVMSFLSDAKHVAFKRYDLISQSKQIYKQDAKYIETKFQSYMQD